MSQTVIVFFDSWGWAWETCEADHPEAQAFGPRGVARSLSEDELFNIGLRSDVEEFQQSPLEFARQGDRVLEKEEDTDWILLVS